MADKYPCTEAPSSIYPDGEEDAAHYIGSSQKVGAGHEDSQNRMPDPNKDWSNEGSGEGKGD